MRKTLTERKPLEYLLRLRDGLQRVHPPFLRRGGTISAILRVATGRAWSLHSCIVQILRRLLIRRPFDENNFV